MWEEGPNEVTGYQYDASQSVMNAGELDPSSDSDFPGPSGVFKLIPEEFWRTIDVADPAPVFLHEAYSAHIEKWVQTVPSPSQEVAIIGKVRDSVMELVDQRLAAEPRAFPVSPTVTAPEHTAHGPAITGRCIVLQPAAAYA